jgi:hypothetical protein
MSGIPVFANMYIATLRRSLVACLPGDVYSHSILVSANAPLNELYEIVEAIRQPRR